MERPLIPIGFGCFAALLAASFVGVSVTPYLAVAALAVAVFLFRSRKKYPLAFALAVTVFAAFSAYSLKIRLSVEPAERYAGNKYHAVIEILAGEGKSYGSFRYRAKVLRLEETGQEVDFDIRLTHSEALSVEPGDTVEAEVRFFPFEDRFGLSSKTSQLAGGKVLGGYISDYGSISVAKAERRPLAYWLSAIRNAVRDRLLETYPIEEGSALTAMLVGLRDDIPAELTEAYRAAGGSHILVISGMHMAIFAQFALGALGVLGLDRRKAAGISLGFIVLFMFFSGMSASVVRSGIMQIILLLGILLGRRPEPLNSLAAALLLMMLWNPFCVGDISLLLSFSATLGVVVISPKLLARSAGRAKGPKAKRILSAVLSPVCASVGAILGALPVQLYVFGTVNFSGLLTSLLTLYVSAWLLRFGIFTAALLFIPFLSPAAAPFVLVTGLLAKLQNWIVCFVADHLPGTMELGGAYLPGVVLIAMLFFFCATALQRRATAFSACLAALLVLIGAGVNTWYNRSGMRLLVLDSPYADCIAILHNGRAEVLYCSGTGATVADALRENGVVSLGLLHVSEKEREIRCAESLASGFPVGTALYPDTVYFPLAGENGTAYGYGADGWTNTGAAYAVSSGGEAVSVSMFGRTVVYAGKNAVIVDPAAADVLVTDDPGTEIPAALTVVLTEDEPETLPFNREGRYIFTNETERTLLRFQSNGDILAFAG